MVKALVMLVISTIVLFLLIGLAAEAWVWIEEGGLLEFVERSRKWTLKSWEVEMFSVGVGLPLVEVETQGFPWGSILAGAGLLLAVYLVYRWRRWAGIALALIVLVGVFAGEVLLGFLLVLLALLGIFLLGLFILPQEGLLWDLVTLPLFRLVEQLAKEDRYFTKVLEGYAVLVTVGGEYDKTLVQWEGRTTNNEGDVVPGHEPRFLDGLLATGGYRWLGLKGQPYRYRLRWHSIREDGEVKRHDEVLTRVLLKSHNYVVGVRDVEDADNWRVDLGFVVVMKCINPRKFIFELQDPIEMVFARIEPIVTDLLGQQSWQEVRAYKKDFDALFLQELEQGDAQSVLNTLKNRFGVEIEEIELRTIELREDYQEASAASRKAEELGKADVVRSRKRGQAVAERIRGLVLGLFGRS